MGGWSRCQNWLTHCICKLHKVRYWGSYFGAECECVTRSNRHHVQWCEGVTAISVWAVTGMLCVDAHFLPSFKHPPNLSLRTSLSTGEELSQRFLLLPLMASANFIINKTHSFCSSPRTFTPSRIRAPLSTCTLEILSNSISKVIITQAVYSEGASALTSPFY